MWCVVDMFGFQWGDLVDSLEEAKRQLTDIRAWWTSQKNSFECTFEIERRWN